MTTTLTASTRAELNQDIATVDAATSGDFTIDLQGNITETANLDAISLQPGVQLTINGSGGSNTLDGAGSFGLVVDAGSVTIENLDIRNAVLSGGSIPGTVTLSNDIFSGTVAISKNLTIDEVALVTLGNTHGPATITNQAGSTYDVDVVGDAIDEGPAGVSRFVNKGTLAQTGVAPGVSEIHIDVTDTGTLSVAGGSNLRFFGANNSFSGTYVGGGMIDYWTGSTDALGTIDMTNGACTTVDGGATVNESGVVTLSTSSTITLVTGTWNFTSNNGLALADPSQPSSSGASFTLYETLAKTGGTGTTVIGCDFNPNGNGSGFIRVAHGTLAFNGLVSNFYEAISGAGTFSIGGGGTDAIDTGTTINTRGWTITQADTDVTLNVALSYSGIFREQSGATLTLTPSNKLTLTNSASFTDATIDGSGTLTLAGGKATMNGGTIGAGVTIELLSGTLSESGIVANSGTLFASGGTVLIAGTANGITVGVSGKEIVQSGGTASNTTVSSGGTEIVLSGGTAIGTTNLAGGTVTVSSGGIFEFTSGATGEPIVLAGATLDIGSGYVFSGTVNSGVKVEILSGGTDSGATVSSGGREIVFAGGTASNTTVLKGGVETVSSGGSASDTTVSSGGTVNVLSGDTAFESATVFGGGKLNISKGGTAHDIAVSSGGAMNVAGTITSDVTVFSGGVETVLSGGVVSGASVADTTLSGGEVNVRSGGKLAFATVLSGGELIVSKGGSAASIVVSGGGNLNVAGTTTSNVTVSSGGHVLVSSGGVASGTTIAGGTVEVASGGSTGGAVTFAANSGTLQLDSNTFSGTFAGMTAQDTIDLRHFSFAARHVTSSITATSATLSVTDGAHVAQIILLGNYMGSTFTPSNDGFGGTSIVDPHVSHTQIASLTQTHKG
jgi:autotransporter passenger strand-loop-strand repeat protein